MSQTGTPATPPVSPATFLNTLKTAAVTSVTGSLPTILKDLDADALGFLGQEADDFNTLITKTVERVEAGENGVTAFEEELAAFAATEKTQLWQDWTNILSQASGIFNGWVTEIKTVLGLS